MSGDTFDGIDVQQFGGRFAGSFDLTESFPVDNEVAFMVVARVTGADMSVTKTGDLKRTTKFAVLEVALTGSNDGSKRMQAAQGSVNEQLELDDDEYDDEDDPRVVLPGAAPVPAVAGASNGVAPAVVTRPELYNDGGWS